jgi:hypothetical protein
MIFVRIEHTASDSTVELWEVATDYVYPVSIGEAAELANEEGCELPSPALVDSIWRAAEIKLKPKPINHNGTIAQMATQPVYEKQYAAIQEQLTRWLEVNVESAIGDLSALLVAGTHKDVVRDPKTGKLGLYGWHQLDGKVIQPMFTGHALSWIDYSQGVRLCRRP